MVPTNVLHDAALVLSVAMTLLWLVHLPLRNASIVDPFWGTAFALVAATTWLHAPTPGEHAAVVLVLVVLWGARLSLHLLVRNWGHGEDRRYVAIRKAQGRHFWLWSLLTVFGLQGLLAWLISWPVQAAIAAPDRPWTSLDVLGIVLALAGTVTEATADWQLGHFLAEPDNRGHVMDRGLWAWSRHPNYFGDSLTWWGFGLLGLGALGPLALLGPALMTGLLLKVSGVSLLERTITERRPAYRAYIERTSAFVPWPPKR